MIPLLRERFHVKTPFVKTVATVVVALLVPLLGGTSAVAAPDDGSVLDVTPTVSTPKLKVRSGSCVKVPVTYRHGGGLLDSVNVSSEVWKGSSYVGTVDAWKSDSIDRVDGSYFWCPYLDGLGTFRIGRTTGDWQNYGDSVWDDAADEFLSTDAAGTVRSTRTVSFVAKQSQTCAVRSSKRAKKRMSVTAKLQHFSVAGSKVKNAKKGTKVVLQRKKGSGWTTVARGKVGAKGLTAVSVKATKKATYRLTQAGSSSTWDCAVTFRR